jgi:hypothetical protein
VPALAKWRLPGLARLPPGVFLLKFPTDGMLIDMNSIFDMVCPLT